MQGRHPDADETHSVRSTLFGVDRTLY